MQYREFLTKSASTKKVVASTPNKLPRPKLAAGADQGRQHPMTSDESPLTRAICKAADLPDTAALMVALAHPMTDQDMQTLARKAGGHRAHLHRIQHLRQMALQKHGEIGTDEPT